MPVKRRIAKGCKRLDAEEIEDLFYGPGSALINGCGYLGRHGDGFWRDKPADVQAAVLEAMRADWERHGPSLLAEWEGRDDHALYVARTYHGDPEAPWALREFGEPGQ